MTKREQRLREAIAYKLDLQVVPKAIWDYLEDYELIDGSVDNAVKAAEELWSVHQQLSAEPAPSAAPGTITGRDPIMVDPATGANVQDCLKARATVQAVEAAELPSVRDLWARLAPLSGPQLLRLAPIDLFETLAARTNTPVRAMFAPVELDMNLLLDIADVSQQLVDRFQWSKAQADRFVFTGEMPVPVWLSAWTDVTRTDGRNIPGPVTLTVVPWVPAPLVYAAYRLIQQQVKPGLNRLPSQRSIALARFVGDRLIATWRRGERKPAWARLLEEWNQTYPQWPYPAGNWRYFSKQYHRVARQLESLPMTAAANGLQTGTA